MNTKTKKYLGNLLLVAIWGIFLAGIIIMSKPKVETLIEPVIEIESNQQYVVKASCYVCPPFCGKMANGEVVYEGAIAIRRSSHIVQNMGLKLEDRVYIEGYGSYKVADIMADWVKADIDLFLDVTHEECMAWGVRELIIEKL